MGQVRVFTFIGTTKNKLETRQYTDGTRIVFSIQPEIKIYIEDWQNLSNATQVLIRNDLDGWTEGTE